MSITSASMSFDAGARSCPWEVREKAYIEDSQGCLCSEEETAPLYESKELPRTHRNISMQAVWNARAESGSGLRRTSVEKLPLPCRESAQVGDRAWRNNKILISKAWLFCWADVVLLGCYNISGVYYPCKRRIIRTWKRQISPKTEKHRLVFFVLSTVVLLNNFYFVLLHPYTSSLFSKEEQHMLRLNFETGSKLRQKAFAVWYWGPQTCPLRTRLDTPKLTALGLHPGSLHPSSTFWL